MGTIRETFQGEDDPENLAMIGCEDRCLATADECEGGAENSKEVCRGDFVFCITDCQVQVSYVS